MNRNWVVVLSIFAVLLFFGGIIGMAIGTRPDTGNGSFFDTDFEEEGEVSFYSSKINAEVKDIYPEIIIVSKTNNFDSSKIQTDLNEIEGMVRTTVEFNQLEEDEIIVIVNGIYEVEKLESIKEEIIKLEYLLSDPIEFYKRGVIDISKTVLFTDFFDENKTKEYQFIDQRIEAIIGINTKKTEEVSGELQVSFIGERLNNALFFEITNITQTPRFVFDKGTFNILEWKEKYRYVIEKEIENPNTKEDLINLFEIDIDILESKNFVLVYNNINDINFNEIEIENPFIEDFEITDQEIIFFLTENLTYTDYELLIQELSNKNNLEIEDIEEKPKVVYQITLKEGFVDVKEKLEELDFIIFEITKKGILDISEIIIENEVFSYHEEEYEYWFLYPEDTNQNSFDFSIQGYATDKELMFLILEKEN